MCTGTLIAFIQEKLYKLAYTLSRVILGKMQPATNVGLEGPKPEWAAKVFELRKTRLNLTQRQFAARLGLTITTVSSWETGTQRPSVEHYIKMAGIAPDPEQAIYFWSAAGIDPQRVARAVAEFDKRRAAQPHSKKPKPDSPAACW
jgi:DNA-binding transcriptional regulator YiaG